MVGRVRGRIVLPNPDVLYQKSLQESAWTFKKNSIYFAGQHFNANCRVIDEKATYAVLMTVALLLEILAFVAWFAW